MSKLLQRYFINQPSTLQAYHSMNGKNVLAAPQDGDNMVTVYFISGNSISAYINKNALSKGWTEWNGDKEKLKEIIKEKFAKKI